MEEAIQYADDLRASNAGTQDLLGTQVHDTMMLRTAETATGKTTSGKKKKRVSKRESVKARARQIVERTALMHAASVGLAESVEMLLGAGAQINATDKNQEGALHRAAERGHEAAGVSPMRRMVSASIFLAGEIGLSKLIHTIRQTR